MSISLPPSTRLRMASEKFKDVNWSRIATTAFEVIMDDIEEQRLKVIDTHMYNLRKERENLVEGIKRNR